MKIFQAFCNMNTVFFSLLSLKIVKRCQIISQGENSFPQSLLPPLYLMNSFWNFTPTLILYAIFLKTFFKIFHTLCLILVGGYRLLMFRNAFYGSNLICIRIQHSTGAKKRTPPTYPMDLMRGRFTSNSTFREAQ